MHAEMACSEPGRRKAADACKDGARGREGMLSRIATAGKLETVSIHAMSARVSLCRQSVDEPKQSRVGQE